jgi:hypothetical protein
MTSFNATPGTIYSDIETWVRRIIKASNTQSVTSRTIAEYVNRFYTYDVPARLQLFEMKSQYIFQAQPYVYQYQFPYQNYQMVKPPVFCDGVQMGYFQFNEQFYQVYPEQPLNEILLQGNGTIGPYTTMVNSYPVLRGFKNDLPYQSFVSTPPLGGSVSAPVVYSQTLQPNVFITTFDSSGTYMIVVDDGQGNLIQTDASFQNGPSGPPTLPLVVGTVNYLTGICTFSFNSVVAPNTDIYVQTVPYIPGVPRFCLFYNNTIKIFPIPRRSHTIKMDCFVTPAQFLSTTSAVPFAYMAEYIARGAARKLMTDTGDTEQLSIYEPYFQEQENFVLRRTERQNSTQRTPTIFSGQTGNFHGGYGRI